MKPTSLRLSLAVAALAATVAALPLQDVLRAPPSASDLALLDPFPTQPLLTFTEGKGADATFKIITITDTHLLDDQTVPGNATNVSRASADAVRQYLKDERPSFLVHDGDIVSGEAANSTSDVRSAVHQIFQPVVDANVPFAKTAGNHDNDKFSTHASITGYAGEVGGKLSYIGQAPASIGAGDVGSDTYFIPVYRDAKAKRGSRPELLIWFFDSRSGHDEKTGATLEDWVHPNTASWITNVTTVMEKAWKTLPPSIVFTHIPPYEFLATQTQGPDSSQIGGVTDERPENFTTSGLKYPGFDRDRPLAVQGNENGYTYSGQDRPFLDALTKGPAGKARIHAIVSGHDHGSDWCAPSSTLRTARGESLPLCMAKHSGFGGYDYDEWNHGTRVFTFSLKTPEQAGTYIRMLTGEKRFETTLSKNF